MNRPDDRRGYIGQPRHRERFDHGDRYRSSREVRDRERDEKRRGIRHNDYSEAEDMHFILLCLLTSIIIIIMQQISDGGSDHGDDTSMRLVSPVGHRERNRDELRRKNSFRDEEGLLSDSGIALLRVPNDDRIRDGVVFQFENYLGFLRKWIEYSNIEMEKTRVPGASQKKINEHITNATFAEKLRIILPPEVSSRDSLVHCDMVITGLPPSVFFGSGFGHKTWLAKAAAAKDLIDKCHRIGLISSRLHAAIGDHPVLEKVISYFLLRLPIIIIENIVKNRRLPDFFKAVDALILLEKKMSREQWPWDVLFARELESITLDKLKMVFTSVMQSIYFTGDSEKRLASCLDRAQVSS
uniref:DNA helicase n=1 Tax=Heterorhabditis bacteriophora TaxID=37862 RepID=A0A1I7XIP0_HETBA